MYGKGKCNPSPSDPQAREKLAMYVYEYLIHTGATKASQLFLQEIRWNKKISIGDAPGFLQTWWCVFWDLYCASPERRETCEHSSEAKAFHDYSSATCPPLNSMPMDGMGQPGMPSGYYPHYGSPRFSGPASRASLQGPCGPQPMLHHGMDHPVRGQMIGMSRMPHPRSLPPGSINPYASEQFQQSFSGMRMPASSMPGHSGMAMTSMQPRSPWANPSVSSGPPSAGLPTTPILRSPQDSLNSDYNPINKQMPQQQQALSSMFPMGSAGPENIPSSSLPSGQAAPLSNSTPITSLNGINGIGGPDPSMLDVMSKNSPGASMPMGPGVSSSIAAPGGPGGPPHTPQGGDGDAFSLVQFGDNDQHESAAAILQIKENMQQDVKRFETSESEVTASTDDFSFMT